MIKLKSLFRRGQGCSSGSSSKHSNHMRKDIIKSHSTSSINSTDEPTTKSGPAAAAELDENNSELTSPAVVPDNHVEMMANDMAAIPPTRSTLGSERGTFSTDSPHLNALPVKCKFKTVAKCPNPVAKMLKKTSDSRKDHDMHGIIADTTGLTFSTNTTIASNPLATTIGPTNRSTSHWNPKENCARVSNTPATATTTSSIHMSTAYKDGASRDFSSSKMNSSPQANSSFANDQENDAPVQEPTTNAIWDNKCIGFEPKDDDLSPYQSEILRLKTELMKLQELQKKNYLEMKNLECENEYLHNRLKDVVNSSLSDAEKQQIIQNSQRLHSSAPASIALPGVSENDGTAYVIPDLDRNSSSSEISLACLQDKIIQMEETHYSTNEELQATLQELVDLQTQLSESQLENERLTEEKDVLFQSLCHQTEKLNETRTQVTTLQDLLVRDAKHADEAVTERETKLMDLVKVAREERQALLVKQEDYELELQKLRQALKVANQDATMSCEQITMLKASLDDLKSERQKLLADLQLTREEASQKTNDINRLTTLLDNTRTKIDELEQEQVRGERSDLSELLEAVRKENDTLQANASRLQEQCSHAQGEIRKLKEQLSAMAEQSKVAKSNAECAMSRLQYRYETMRQENDKLAADYQQLLNSKAELQIQCKCHIEDKVQLQNILGNTQTHLSDLQAKLTDTEEQLNNEMKLRIQETEEWKQFQSDLLMTVRVANDFKSEALSAREQLVLDNKILKEKIRALEQQIDNYTKLQMQQNGAHQSVLSTVQQEIASRCNKNTKQQDSRLSVKNLIETIENNKQQLKFERNATQYNSTPSLNDGNHETVSVNILPATVNITKDWPNTVCAPMNVVNQMSAAVKRPLREQSQPQPQMVANRNFTNLSNATKPLISGERKDPLNMLAKNGGSKRNALLKWCQNKTVGYRYIDITNFSSSWNDGLAFCAILHSYLPDSIPYDALIPANKTRNFSFAFAAAESVGITTTLNINEMCQIERPDWTQVMTYVTAIYKHFET